MPASETAAINRATALIFRIALTLRTDPVEGLSFDANQLVEKQATLLTRQENRCHFQHSVIRLMGMVREITGGRRNRLFAYGPYIDLLAEGT
jgi:hypothetical protein